MDGRKEKHVRKERANIRGMLNDTFAGSQYDLYINDPILKEKHQPNKTMSIKTSGLTPQQVFEMDLTDVEKSNCIYWSTADKYSEGSEVEVAGAGWLNRWLAKRYIKPTKRLNMKLIILVGKHRYEAYKNSEETFQSLWPNAIIVQSHEDAMKVLRRYYKIKPGGVYAVHSKRKNGRKIARS